MDATLLPPDADLPEDVPALQSMVRSLLAENARLRAENAALRAEVARLKAEVEQLKAKLGSLLKHRFGQRCERQPRVKPDKDKPKRKAHPHGRKELPPELERRTTTYDLSEEEKRCPCCGEPRQCLGEEVTEQLDVEPIKFFVRRTVKRKYVCTHCDEKVPVEDRFRTAGPEQVGPIAKGLPGPGLLAHVLVAKYADHVPLNRLAGQLRRSGVSIPRSTLGDWVSQGADLLRPLMELMHTRLLRSRLVHSDDTGAKLRVEGKDKTAKAHLWAYIGDADYPYVVFDFTTDYKATGPAEFLEGYKGYLQADALAQYECLYGEGKARHCCCWAHGRRKFVEARDGGDDRATEAVGLIGQLYAVERTLPDLLPPSDDPVKQEQRQQREEQRRQIRQQSAVPVLEALKDWLEANKDKAPPKTKLGQAIGYALGNWAALCRYVEEGYLAIDNNLSERTLRAIAIGRNNWGVIGSAAGGDNAAVLYSIVGTCKHLSIDPFSYLREALPGLFALGEKPTTEQLAEWLPDRWLLRQGRDSPTATAPAG